MNQIDTIFGTNYSINAQRKINSIV